MRHFLFVDHAANLRMVDRLMLETNGYEIFEAGSDGKALPGLLHEERASVAPDGELGGLQLLNEIRPPRPQDDQCDDNFYDWEAEAFGVKPADLLELQGALAWPFQPQTRGAAGKRCSRL